MQWSYHLAEFLQRLEFRSHCNECTLTSPETLQHDLIGVKGGGACFRVHGYDQLTERHQDGT